ncbi:hypothetical protein PsorP6_017665 [Peronosclerospora sorghi]|uniref:Uncharacterized protein n=1 Tax=Peronosclerospora sorghi TaxID=230839 RepID=A0ACC0WM19_9STRA|nr:hypothetical protein PsorP6_017665 [Peronosclerospora sorghi]
MTQRGQGEPLDRRRRASSNYFELDADRRRNQSERSARFSTRLTSMDMAPLAPGKGVAQDDEVAIDYCCDVLKAKFGFQDGSVSNQREHALLLLANGRARHLTPNDHATEAHVVHLAETLLSNYRSWCAFLDTEPRTYTGTDVPTASPPQGHYYMDMLLYLLIWGEAANVRHMPECLCYLYHQLVHGLNADPHAQDTHPDGWYLHHVITPLWRAASAMQRRNAAGHALEHVHVRNYDDLNEFFWTRACLAVDVVDVGDHVQTHHGKTFYEHRSLLTLVLHYYRIFQFNGVFFVALVVLAFAVTISPAGGARGWRQFQALGSVVDPYTSRDLTLALVALPLSFSALASLKCLLEVGHAWHVLVATRRTSWPYALALTLRGAWHGTFAAVFASMLHVPLTHGRETPLLDQLHVLAAAYLPHVRAAALDVLEEILDLPEPDVPSPHLGDHTVVHALGVVRNFVAKMETLLTALQRLCTDARVARAFASTHFCTQSAGFVYASHGLVNLCRSDTAMGAATRACLLLSLDRSEAMPRTSEAQRRLGFFMKSLVMDMPSLGSIKEMRSFSVVTPFYAETVLFSLQELNDPLVNHPIFQHVEEEDKKVTILKYLTTIHEEEWENFLERLDISMFEGKLANGAGETSLAREAHRLGQFLDFCRLNSLFYSHTGFYFATWMTIVTTFVYMYCKVYLALTGVQTQIWEFWTIGVVVGAAVGTLGVLGVANRVSRCVHVRAPSVRAAVYLAVVVTLVVVFFCTTMLVWQQSLQATMALFFGYFAALYGLNEMARMYSFAHASIATVGAFQHLAFLFDFVFSVVMLVPLVLLSALPFLNIVQTRMMYNKGFSDVVSASSQYAFSLAAVMGGVGGVGCGWLFHLFTTLESTAGFLSYVTTFDLLRGQVGTGVVTYAFYLAAVGGCIGAGGVSYCIGRRLTIVAGGLAAVVGMLCVSCVPSSGGGFLFPGICALGVSVGTLVPTLAVYIYEISTRDMRGKALLLLGSGFIGGMGVAAYCSSSAKDVGWGWQVFVATVLVSVLTPAVYLFPESPSWVYMRQGLEACERCLTVLRRKEGVTDELHVLQKEDEGATWTLVKLSLGLVLMLVSGLWCGCMNMYVSDTLRAVDAASYMFVNCVSLQLVGALLSFLFLDRIPHQRIVLWTMVVVGTLVAVLGVSAQTMFVTGTARAVLLETVGLVVYFFAGLGLSAVPWVTCVGLFGTTQRAVYVPLAFALFFLMPVVSTYVRAQRANYAYMYLYALTALCLVTMMLLLCVGTRKNGMICTKREMEAERECLRRLRASRRSARTPGSARSKNFSRSRAKSHSNYQMYESPAASCP